MAEIKLCDSCYAAFLEEGCPEESIEEMAWMGGDIADHLCDNIESDGMVPCSCRGHE